MNRRLLGLIVCLALGLGIATAQERDAFMERYLLAVENLDQSVTSLPDNAAESLESLERAAGALRPLSEATTSDTLIAAMESTFERARTAVTNSSQTDLAVQVAVLKGGFERIAYESALRVARDGNRELAQARLARLAVDMGLPQVTRDAFNGAPLPQLQLTFERGVAAAIGALVERARAQAASNVGGAYRSLATAYGHYIPIQDSPRISAEVGTSFVAAFDALVNHNGQGLAPTLAGLITQADALHQAVDATFEELEGEAAAPSAPAAAPATVQATPAQDATAAVVDAPVVAPATVAAEPSTGPATANVEAPAPAPSPAPSAAAADASPSEAVVATAAIETAANADVSTAEAQPDPELLALERNLAPYRLSPATLDRLVALYRRNDLRSVEEALDELYSTGARALVAVKAGQQAEARNLMISLRGDYRRFLEPLVEGRDSAFNATTLSLMERLEVAPALRVQDLVVLVEHTSAIAGVLDGQDPALAHRLAVTAVGAWAGFLRLTLMIVLGVLALVPLYLLNLAFGGGNRNWRWIGASLLLLLLPVIYEGLSFLGSLAAGLSGIEALNVLSVYSVFQSTLAQLVWVVLTLVAIAFAVTGLYGICVQFGLLGRNQDGTSVDNATRFSGSDGAPEAAVDWDEEF